MLNLMKNRKTPLPETGLRSASGSSFNSLESYSSGIREKNKKRGEKRGRDRYRGGEADESFLILS